MDLNNSYQFKVVFWLVIAKSPRQKDQLGEAMLRVEILDFAIQSKDVISHSSTFRLRECRWAMVSIATLVIG